MITPKNSDFGRGQPSEMRKYSEMLEKRWRDGLFLCVGLDPDPELIPAFFHKDSDDETLFEFNRRIIDATAEFACAFKPNLAFYEQSGPPGLLALKRTCDYLRSRHFEIPVILDAKRGDIASTNKGYIASLFDYYGGDAVTVQPYLGGEALNLFFERAEKGIIVLCRTSNPGSGELQELQVAEPGKAPEPLYLRVARLAATAWNKYGNVSLVAGATYPQELAEIRKAASDLPLLVPGIGAQGGDLDAVLKYGRDSRGMGLVINSSRGIIYAGKDTPDAEQFVEAARQAARTLAEQIRERL